VVILGVRSGRIGVPDESGVRCHHRPGTVTLTCGPEAFARLAKAVAAAAGPPVAVPADADVVIIDRVKPDPPPDLPWSWLDWGGAIGCAAVLVTVSFLLGMGAYTVSQWVWQP
jgi:hypothetical protein